jgi:hypothetical protein
MSNEMMRDTMMKILVFFETSVQSSVTVFSLGIPHFKIPFLWKSEKMRYPLMPAWMKKKK